MHCVGIHSWPQNERSGALPCLLSVQTHSYGRYRYGRRVQLWPCLLLVNMTKSDEHGFEPGLASGRSADGWLTHDAELPNDVAVVAHVECLYSYGLSSYGLYSYGLYGYGLYRAKI